MSGGVTKAFISLFLVSVFWGCNFPISAFLLHSFSPVILSTVRMCSTSLFLLIVTMIYRGMKWPTMTEWKYLFGVGIFGTLLNQTFYFTGLHHSTPANASLIMAMAPIATILLERIIFQVKVTMRKSIGAMVSLIGVFSIIGVAKGSVGISTGDLNIFIATLSISISLLFLRGLTKTMSSYMITVYSTVLGSVLMIPAAGVEKIVAGNIISHSPFIWLLLISAGILAQGVAGFWWNSGVAKVGAGTAAIFMNIQPFVAIIASHFILGNPIMLSQIVGGCLVLLGVCFANLPSGKPVLSVEPNKSV